MSSDQQIQSAVAAAAAARDHLAALIERQCPGPHGYVQHRDRQQPWCPRCGYGANGERVRTPAPEPPRERMTARYMMATTAYHRSGDLSRPADLALIYGEDGEWWIGEWVYGYGFVEVRFPKAATRPLTPAERERFNYRRIEGGPVSQILIRDDGLAGQLGADGRIVWPQPPDQRR